MTIHFDFKMKATEDSILFRPVPTDLMMMVKE